MKRLLTSLLGWREFDGLLQASGWIGKEPGQDWLGATTVLLDKASFDIPRNKFRTERVRLGGGQLDLFAEQDSIRASLDLSIGENARIQGEARAERIAGCSVDRVPGDGSASRRLAGAHRVAALRAGDRPLGRAVGCRGHDERHARGAALQRRVRR